jgi:hypothetical protein
VEIVAAILFLVPITTIVGGYALLVIFAVAAVIHLLTANTMKSSGRCSMPLLCW